MTAHATLAQECLNAVHQALGKDVLQSSAANDEPCIFVSSVRVAEALLKLRDDPAVAMTQLMDVCGVDYPEKEKRFEVVYHLLSLRHNWRLRVKVQTDENTPVPTVAGAFSAAGWFEREAWDLFGVRFDGHADLRRILTDYGFEGHPLRKDFPLVGHVEVRYDLVEKRVAYQPVKLAQEFRDFDFISPWQGMTDVMRPGNSRKPEGKA